MDITTSGHDQVRNGWLSSPSTTDASICTGNTTDVYIDLANVADLYGYQFQVSYDQTKAERGRRFRLQLL